MKKLLNLVMLMIASVISFAQANVLPAPAQKGVMYVKNVTIHVGNGTVIENGVIVVKDGKIEKVGKDIVVPADATNVIDGQGKQVYPGLILPSSSLGLVEISSIRATNDAREIGDMNPNVRSIVAYNTDSKVINTLRSNGILAANIIPQGSFLAGSSSVVQLDAWNWQDASLKTDGGMHLYMPSLMPRPSFGRRGGGAPGGPNPGAESDPVKEGIQQLENLKAFFREAKAYYEESAHNATNLKFEAVKGLFSKKQKFFVHCNIVKEMLVAIDFAKEFGFEVVIVGGSDSYLIADILKQNNIPVILSQMHDLPTLVDDDVDQPYKTPAMLQKAGVLFGTG